MVANVEPVADRPAAEVVEQRHLVAVEPHIADEPRVVERHLARRIVIGIVLTVPVVTVLYVLLVALALRGSGAPLTAALLMGAGIGAYAALFWGFWFGLAASVREIEELEARARRERR